MIETNLVHYFRLDFPRSILILYTYLHIDFPNCLSPSSKTVYRFVMSFMSTAWSSHFISLLSCFLKIKGGLRDQLTVCVCVCVCVCACACLCISPNVSRFYVVSFVSNESRRLVLPRTSCSPWYCRPNYVWRKVKIMRPLVAQCSSAFSYLFHYTLAPNSQAT
jgi:hypothetical protein